MTYITCTGSAYSGVAPSSEFCSVTIMRAGEAMERGVRECYKDIETGHILIQQSQSAHAQVGQGMVGGRYLISI